MTAKVDCRVFVISALYRTKQATLPRQNNQIYFGFGKNITIFSHHIRNLLMYLTQKSKDLDPRYQLYISVIRKMFA